MIVALVAVGMLLMQQSTEGFALENGGNEFFLGFQQGHIPPKTQLQLFVSTNEPSSVMFTVETGDREFSYNGRVTNATVHLVDIPRQYQVQITDAGVTNKGIHVEAEPGKEVVIQGLMFQRSSADAYSAIPCSAISDVVEYEYYAVTYHSSLCCFDGSTVLLVGCEDNTTVTIDDSTTLTLNRLQTYLHYQPTIRSDLTGTHYLSSRPISVFAGHPCTNVPSDMKHCDSLVEQIPPTATWGRFFLSKSFEGRQSGEIYRVLAAYPVTIVMVTCNTVVVSLSLNKSGSWEEFRTPGCSYCSIESNYPVLVMQFMQGTRADETRTGDPFMMMLPPVDQYSNHYNLRVIPKYTLSYITLYVATNDFQPQSILVDGSSLEEKLWTAVLCANGTVCGYVASLQVQRGDHQVVHQSAGGKVGVSVHGMARSKSYGYFQYALDFCDYGEWSGWSSLSGSDFSKSSCSSGQAYKQERVRVSASGRCSDLRETQELCCIYGEWTEWEVVEGSEIHVDPAQCSSRGAFQEIRFQSSPVCERRIEARLMCMPDREDQLIMTFNLGRPSQPSTTTDIPPTSDPPPTNSTPSSTVQTVLRRQALPLCPILDPGNDGYICQDLRKRRQLYSTMVENSFATSERQASIQSVTINEDPVPFEWRRHHRRFRRQSQLCGPQSPEDHHILFILDGSGSVGSSNFASMTSAVGKLTGLFCKRPKVAVMTFSSSIRLEFCFDCFDDDSEGRKMTESAIRAIPFTGGNTHTGEAAKCGCEQVLNPRGLCNFPQDAHCTDIIFITDGHSNGALEICDEVKCMHRLNNPGSSEVNTYALGIGNGVNPEEIECITNSNNNLESIFRYDNFGDFEAAIATVESRIESSQQQYDCANVEESSG